MWIDVSRSGLGFRYIAEEDMGDVTAVTILARAGCMIRIENIPARAVYDLPVQPESYSIIPMRQCGVEFGALSLEQRSQIESLIENCTAGMVHS